MNRNDAPMAGLGDAPERAPAAADGLMDREVER